LAAVKEALTALHLDNEELQERITSVEMQSGNLGYPNHHLSRIIDHSLTTLENA